MNSFTSNSDENATSHDRNAKRFVFAFSLVFLFFSLIYWVSRSYFVHTGDLLSMREAARSLLRKPDGCLYRNIISSRTHYLFKRELLRARQDTPRVVALGSSRMLLFHERMFSRSFLNMGRAGNHLRAALHVLRELEEKPPEVLLIGVDFWWFHPVYARRPGETVRPRDISPDNISDVVQMLRKGLQSPDYLLDAWRKDSCNLGVDAILHERGFDKSGFMYSGIMKRKKAGTPFADVMNRIRKGRKKFEWAEQPDWHMLSVFAEAVARMVQRGTSVYLFMPPLPSRVAKEIANTDKYEYVKHVRERLSAMNGVTFIHFDDGARMFTDCQFVDGMHQGDTANAKILLLLAAKDSKLAPYLNLDFLEWMASYENNALVLNSLRLQIEEEDFLGLGCEKQRVSLPPRLQRQT